MTTMTVWDAEDEFSDSLALDVQPGVGPHGAAVVSLWAGDEYDPAYLTPAAARKAAVELPAILLRLAVAADPGHGAPAWCWRWRAALALIFMEGRRP